MTSKLRTMRTIEINGEYRVRTGETENGEIEAVVDETYISIPLFASFAALSGDNDPHWSYTEDAPIVTAKSVYTAAGKAVDEYIQTELIEIEEETS